MENYFYLKLEVIFFYLELKVKILTNYMYLDSMKEKNPSLFFIIQNLPAFYQNIKSILSFFFLN